MAKDVQPTYVLHTRLRRVPLEALTKALIETANDIEKDKQTSCAHFLGYLKTRRKGAPIPDECLVCAALMKCR